MQQENEEISTPEIAKFKSSQKLLNMDNLSIEETNQKIILNKSGRGNNAGKTDKELNEAMKGVTHFLNDVIPPRMEGNKKLWMKELIVQLALIIMDLFKAKDEYLYFKKNYKDLIVGKAKEIATLIRDSQPLYHLKASSNAQQFINYLLEDNHLKQPMVKNGIQSKAEARDLHGLLLAACDSLTWATSPSLMDELVKKCSTKNYDQVLSKKMELFNPDFEEAGLMKFLIVLYSINMISSQTYTKCYENVKELANGATLVSSFSKIVYEKKELKKKINDSTNQLGQTCFDIMAYLQALKTFALNIQGKKFRASQEELIQKVLDLCLKSGQYYMEFLKEHIDQISFIPDMLEEVSSTASSNSAWMTKFHHFIGELKLYVRDETGKNDVLVITISDDEDETEEKRPKLNIVPKQDPGAGDQENISPSIPSQQVPESQFYDADTSNGETSGNGEDAAKLQYPTILDQSHGRKYLRYS
uniref:Uncharacterized protein n=1 Tax=Panagrolaimus sp. ES5 TaxID=591445 RepID=A0AC34GWJ3_9BILA